MRYYRRSYGRRGKKTKYSFENRLIQALLPTTTTTQSFVAIPPISSEGMRKIAHITIRGNFTIPVAAGDVSADLIGNQNIYWALVYVPGGYSPNNLNQSSTGVGSLYEPNQNLLTCGCITPTQTFNVKYHLKRNLNSGDSIYILMRSDSQNSPA